MEPSILWLRLVAIVPVAGGGAGGEFLPGSSDGGCTGGLFLGGDRALWGTGFRLVGGVLVALDWV